MDFTSPHKHTKAKTRLREEVAAVLVVVELPPVTDDYVVGAVEDGRLLGGLGRVPVVVGGVFLHCV